MKRDRQQGSITRLKDGRFWARAPLNERGQRLSLGYFATEEEAIVCLSVGQEVLAKKAVVPTGVTFLEFASTALDDRELSGYRDSYNQRNIFKVHIATAPFAKKALVDIVPTDIAAWLRTMSYKKALCPSKNGKATNTTRRLSVRTVRRAFSALTQLFEQAGLQGRGLITTNPCRGLRVNHKDATKTEEPWTFLTVAEQEQVAACQAMPVTDRLSIMFAIGTGLRYGEQFHLQLRDVHVDGPEPHVVVRFGSKGKLPKSGKIRTVPLFGLALQAVKEWLALLPKLGGPNPHKVLWPIAHPIRKRFTRTLALAGITRHVRWHDLRHTCASSLVAGFWGEPWTLSEVQKMLGHASVVITEKYAHLGENALTKAARKVTMTVVSSPVGGPIGGALVGGQLVGGGGNTAPCEAAIRCDSDDLTAPRATDVFHTRAESVVSEWLRDGGSLDWVYEPTTNQSASPAERGHHFSHEGRPFLGTGTWASPPLLGGMLPYSRRGRSSYPRPPSPDVGLFRGGHVIGADQNWVRRERGETNGLTPNGEPRASTVVGSPEGVETHGVQAAPEVSAYQGTRGVVSPGGGVDGLHQQEGSTKRQRIVELLKALATERAGDVNPLATNLAQTLASVLEASQ